MMAFHFRGARFLKHGLKLLCLFLALMAFMLLIAHFGLQNPDEAAAIKSWMTEHRYSWFILRLALYVGIGWGAWKIWHAPGFWAEYRRPLIRMLIVSAVFILICEWVLLGRGA
jgi:hypothetical protein